MKWETQLTDIGTPHLRSVWCSGTPRMFSYLPVSVDEIDSEIGLIAKGK